MTSKKYFVLLIDLVGSQGLLNRETGTRKLKHAIDGLNKSFREGLFSPMEITRGDEAAAVLRRIDMLVEMLLKFIVDLKPFECRMVVTYDFLTAGLASKRSTEIDGPAFYTADGLMRELKKTYKIFTLSTNNPALDSEITTLFNLMLLRWAEMTPFQCKVVQLYRQGMKQKEIGKYVKRTQQQVSQVIKSVSYDILEGAELTITSLMSELQNKLKTKSAHE